MRRWIFSFALLVGALSVAVVAAPRATAPDMGPYATTTPVVVYDAAGNVVSSFGGGGGSATGSREQDVTESRTLGAASTSSQQIYTLNGQSTFSFNLAGLTASGATVSFFQSNDWNGTTGTFTGISEVNTGTGIASLTRSTDGQSAIGIEGTKAIKVQVTNPGTGTITLATNISVRSRYQALRSPLPPGGNLIGSATTLPTSTTGATTAFTAGTTSAQALAAAARKFLAIANESATASISCAFGSNAALNTAGSFTLPPLTTRTWNGTYVPADAVNCIGGATSVPVTLQAN